LIFIKLNLKIILIFFFLIHLLSIFFYPTNFEGAYGEYSNFFTTSNKINYVLNYYSAQFNTYFFSFISSIINYFIPIFDGYQIIRILSASSYFFLIPAIINIFNFFQIKKLNTSFLLLLLLNPIIFYYGFRMYSDLFAFSLSIFFFSKLITKDNKHPFFYLFFYGIGVLLKIYNLIFLPIIIFIFYKKLIKFQKIKFFYLSLIYFLLILTPLFIYVLLLNKYLGFYLLPDLGTDDLLFSFFRPNGVYFVVNNFIFYIGYLNLICMPILLLTFINKNCLKFKYLFVFFFLIFFSFLLSPYLFISSELDLGPLQHLISDYYYKSLIFLLFFCFFFQFYFLCIKYKKNKKFLTLIFLIFSFIIIFLFILSNIKASQRYLVLPVVFFYIINWEYLKIQRITLYLCQLIFIILNLCLLLNYYIVGASSYQVVDYLKREQLIGITNVNVILPHVHHLYNNIAPKIENIPSFFTSGIENKYLFSGHAKYIVNYNDNRISKFNSSISFFGLSFTKFSVNEIAK